MKKFIKGFICRSKNTDRIMISTGIIPPEKHPTGDRKGWYFHVPGWFHTMPIHSFKRNFGFSIKPGTHKPIKISIEEEKG